MNNPLNWTDPLGLWYIDINLSAGFIFGGAGGIMISDTGIYPYIGGGLTTPGAGVSLTSSLSDPTPGLNVGLQAQLALAFQRGFAFGEGGGWFTEWGVGWPPGIALTAYHVFGPFFGANTKVSGDVPCER